MSFHAPSYWCLLLLLALPLLWWRWSRRSARPVVVFSGLGAARAAGTTWAVRMRWLPPVLRTLALVCVIVGLARPRIADERTRILTEGIAIQLVLDRSGSMLALDFEIDGARADRLTAVKRVVEDFVVGTDGLPGRPNDFIGLIVFGTYADSMAPLTRDHDHLVEQVRAAEVSDIPEEQATALGDAMALGVERIRSLQARAPAEGRRAMRSNVMIVLTDGEATPGGIDPLTAAEMAAAFGIRVYTIGAGSERSMAPVPRVDPFGRRYIQNVAVSIDEETLRKIAAMTDGRYFRAKDSRSLREIYAQIDALERTEIEEQRFSEYTELGVQSGRIGPFVLPPVLAVGFVLLMLDVVLRSTWLRRVPG